jgi:hypothetical protein
MRTTIDLPEDLHGIVTSLAAHTRRSLSQTAVELMRRGLAAPASAPVKARTKVFRHPGTGLPVVRMSRPITPEDVMALDDES